jgi:hypothetical protein
MSNVVWRQPGTAADDHTMNAHRGIACGTLGAVWKAGKSRVWHRVAVAAAVAGLAAPLAVVPPAAGSVMGAGTARLTGPAPPDVVTRWNLTMIAGLEAAAVPPPPSARIGAIVQASVFDAVNGIDRRYAYYHVPPAAPHGTSRDAAAASAAYTALVALIPAQKPLFDAQLAATLAQLSDDPSHPGQSVQRGLAWGTTVADGILAWRATDRYTTPPPPYTVTPGPATGSRLHRRSSALRPRRCSASSPA